MRQKLLSITQNLRLPVLCVLCNQFHKDKLAVCSDCIALLPKLGPACYRCAEPLADDTSYSLCGHCIKNPPHFDNAFIPFVFEEPLRSLLHTFKYHNGLYLASFFTHLMHKSVSQMTIKPQCLIPIPMHKKKLKQRGFNQAVVLTQLLSKQLTIPYDLSCCKKIINTAAQASLNREQRQANVKRVFQASKIPYTHITLVDDLLTTGSTANELAFTLKQIGVLQVDVLCCARRVL